MPRTELSLSPQLYEQVKNALVELTAFISSDFKAQTDYGLYGGLSGELLFLFEASRQYPDLVDELGFSSSLERLQERLGDGGFDLSGGLAGEAWLLEYFNQADETSYDSELLEEVDQIFTGHLSQGGWPGELEMVLGLGGYAVYAARRARKTDQAQLYGAIVSAFEQHASELEKGILSWSQPAKSVFRFNTQAPEQPEFNLGLAHGVTGILAAVLPAFNIPVLQSRVRRLLEQGADWLLQQQNPKGETQSCFPSVAGEYKTSRLGWCYGDLTIALTLARIGHYLDRPAYIEKALEIALHAAKRDAVSGAISDAGLCHGHIGLALIFRLLHKELSHPTLAEAAVGWLEYGMDQYHKQGVRAFYRYDGVKQSHEEDVGLLMGFSGVGLGLLAFSGGDTDWVDCLLMG